MSDRYKGAILSPTAPTVTSQSAGGIYTSSQQLQYQGQGVWPQAVNYPINNSLRFRRSATAYLNRTPASASNRTTYTWSGWIKLGLLGAAQEIFGSGTGSNQDLFNFNADNQFVVFTANASQTILRTAQLFRDPSAWYHIIVAVDTTQATASNRTKIYVNGVQVTAFEYTQYPSQNYQGSINNTGIHYISTYDGSNWAFDGYMAEVNFVDGTQLTPSSFGTTDAYGIWQPIPYTGAYGTNGFYLPFTDNSALTTSSNVGLGKDFSGNGNYWVTNNISITAGSTYDSMKDVPTNTNSNTANYCVLNPIFNVNGTNVTYSNGNLTFSHPANSGNAQLMAIRGTIALPAGKYYWEYIVGATVNDQVGIGNNVALGGSPDGTAGARYLNSGAFQSNYTNPSSAASYTTNDIIGVAYDQPNGTLAFYKNNSLQGTITNISTTEIFFPSRSPSSSGTGGAGSFNFGQQPFTYTPPTGFLPLNTYNLPTPTILDGDQYMDVTTYTGTGSTQSIVNSGAMQPDFVWTKQRSGTANNCLLDSVRGVSRVLFSDLTNAEANDPGYYVTAFNSNGFSVGLGSGSNGNGSTYVAWQWRASNAAGVSNTQGTITSTVSANTTAGFSIVLWTGNGVTSATVGHGLGVVPAMIICKERSASGEYWHVKHQSTASNTNLFLNRDQASTSAASVGDGVLSDLTSSTTFGFATAGSPGNVVAVNENGVTNVAYCFSAVAGYSAFGSYTGNGSSDGPFVYTGFRPRYVMIKRSDSTADWNVRDTARSPYNVVGEALYPNLALAEYSGSETYLDILSNGFKLRGNWNSSNASSGTYVYMAFAENPFKIARGR
jgi:hypothetical protein